MDKLVAPWPDFFPRALAWAGAAVALLAASFLGIRIGATKVSKGDSHPIRLEIPLPDEVATGWLDSVAISPDGHKLVFAGPNTDGKRLLWMRDLDSLQPHPLPGVEGESPVWSPDSRSIGFFSETGKLQRVDAAGGSPVTLPMRPEPTWARSVATERFFSPAIARRLN